MTTFHRVGRSNYKWYRLKVKEGRLLRDDTMVFYWGVKGSVFTNQIDELSKVLVSEFFPYSASGSSPILSVCVRNENPSSGRI